MKLLVPDLGVKNDYIRLVYASHAPEWQLTADLHDAAEADVLNLHWPEIAFRNHFDSSVGRFTDWLTTHRRVVLFRHNVYPHNATAAEREIYDRVYERADAVVHLGEHSKEGYVRNCETLPGHQEHHLVFHPLYPGRKAVDAVRAKALLGVPREKKVVLVFGSQRLAEDEAFFEDVARRSSKDVVFIRCGNRPYGTALKSLRRFKKYLLFPLQNARVNLTANVTYLNRYVDAGTADLVFSAADLVFIHRGNQLNSGVPYLAWSYGKVVLAPAAGNLTEHQRRMGHPHYVAGDVADAVAHIGRILPAARTMATEDVISRARHFYDPQTIAGQVKAVNNTLTHEKI